MRVIICSGCGIEVPYAYTSTKYCYSCRKKKNQKDKNQWKINNSDKQKAGLLIATEIRAKRLIKPSLLKCNICKNKATDYHHFNYKYPLSVIPLCHSCHIKLHKEKLK
jgi:hypothetical protein